MKKGTEMLKLGESENKTAENMKKMEMEMEIDNMKKQQSAILELMGKIQ